MPTILDPEVFIKPLIKENLKHGRKANEFVVEEYLKAMENAINAIILTGCAFGSVVFNGTLPYGFYISFSKGNGKRIKISTNEFLSLYNSDNYRKRKTPDINASALRIEEMYGNIIGCYPFPPIAEYIFISDIDDTKTSVAGTAAPEDVGAAKGIGKKTNPKPHG